MNTNCDISPEMIVDFVKENPDITPNSVIHELIDKGELSLVDGIRYAGRIKSLMKQQELSQNNP